jgi:hypothetical protein
MAGLVGVGEHRLPERPDGGDVGDPPGLGDLPGGDRGAVRRLERQGHPVPAQVGLEAAASLLAAGGHDPGGHRRRLGQRSDPEVGPDLADDGAVGLADHDVGTVPGAGARPYPATISSTSRENREG